MGKAAGVKALATKRVATSCLSVRRVVIVVIIASVGVIVLGRARGVPLIAYIVGALLVALQYLTVHRKWGRHLYAVGGDTKPHVA